MSWVLALLLLAISKPAVSQCDYVYVAQPPASQLICDPFPINRLQLVCSLFVQQVPELLTIQWFFSTTPVSGLQVGRVDARLLRQVDFQVARPDTFTSRIVVSNPPIGFYFCQPLLAIERRPLVRSNVAQFQQPLINLRPCLVDEFQNVSVPFCALQGVQLGPDQIITPAPANDTDDIQYITPTALNQVTPTPAVQANINDGSNAGLIAGVVIAAIIIVAMATVATVGFVVFYLIWKKKHNSKFPRTFNSRRLSNEQKRYAIPVANITTDAHDDQESSFTPPSKPPPRLRGFTNNRATDHQYNRLKRPTSDTRKNNSRERSSDTSAYYITPEHNDDRVTYYGEFNEELLDDPYIDDSESLVYTDSHYGAESDIHLQQQKKQQEFVRSSSLELQSDEEGKLVREAAITVNTGNQMARDRSRHNYQNCAVLSRTPKDVSNTGTTPYYQEIVATRELKTEYTSADVLESTAS